MGYLFLLLYVGLVLLGLGFTKSRLFILARNAEIFSTFSAITLTLLGLFSEDRFFNYYTWKDSSYFLIVLSIISYFISFYISNSRELEFKNFKEVKNKLKVAVESNKKLRDQYYYLCSEYINDVFNNFFESTGGGGNSRVSLYKHSDNHFKLLGIHSDNPLYNKRKETLYPDDSGFIALGWQNRTFSIFNIPEWKKSGSEYKSFVKSKCGITDERLSSINMHSRSYYIYRFDNNTGDGNPYGIIVFERINESEIPVELINNIIEQHKKQISNLLKSMNALYKIDE
jgi:hypothetical protein